MRHTGYDLPNAVRVPKTGLVRVEWGSYEQGVCLDVRAQTVPEAIRKAATIAKENQYPGDAVQITKTVLDANGRRQVRIEWWLGMATNPFGEKPQDL